MFAGLWLTPFYLHLLGPHDYGIWLVGLQVLTFVLLADLGVLAVVPRDVAREHGRELSEPQSSALQVLIAQTTKVVVFQTLLVGLAAAALFLFRIRGSSSLQGPVGVVLLVFVLTYPLRLFPAILTGLQDLKFLGQVRIWLWTISTGLTVLLLLAGARFYALAYGWCLQEVSCNLAGLWRLRRTRPDLMGFKAWHQVGSLQWEWFKRGLWVSVSQIAMFLLAGADILIVARVLGPATVVIYSCTCKLVAVLQNQPQTLASIALPGLSQMKVAASRERRINATVCLTQGMLVVAGAVFSVVLALNKDFVTLWVGPKFFGGLTLTILVVMNFLVRLVDYTLALALFAFGHEKVSAIRFLLDGVVSVSVASLLIGPLGLPGVVIGFLCGAACVAIPIDIYLLARELQLSLVQIVQPYVPYLWRCGVVGLVAFAIMQTLEIPSLFILAIVAAAIGIVYMLIVIPHVWRSALGDYLRSAITSLQSFTRSRMLRFSSIW